MGPSYLEPIQTALDCKRKLFQKNFFKPTSSKKKTTSGRDGSLVPEEEEKVKKKEEVSTSQTEEPQKVEKKVEEKEIMKENEVSNRRPRGVIHGFHVIFQKALPRTAKVHICGSIPEFGGNKLISQTNS